MRPSVRFTTPYENDDDDDDSGAHRQDMSTESTGLRPGEYENSYDERRYLVTNSTVVRHLR
jgi:hypothetical protein